MEKPKLNESYWYIDLQEDGWWQISQAVNTLSYMDVYHIANHNCFASLDEAQEHAYDLLLALSGESEETVAYMLYEKRL